MSKGIISGYDKGWETAKLQAVTHQCNSLGKNRTEESSKGYSVTVHSMVKIHLTPSTQFL